MKRVLGIIVIGGQLVFGSVLSDRAATLTKARQLGIMLTNTSLNQLDLHYSLLFWNDSGIWDPVKKKVRWVGAGGTCCQDPAYRMINYDESGDTWDLKSTPYSGSGHAYDANGFDPVSGIHYFAMLGDSKVRTWNDQSWSSLPNAPVTGTTPSLTWFPDINNGKGGLIFAGNSGSLAWWDGSKWTQLSSVGLGGYNQFSQYNPVHKVVWVGNGTSHYLIDENLNVKKMKSSPISCSNGSTIHTCDPVSGKFIVVDVKNGKQFWEWDSQKDVWSKIDDMTPKFTWPSGSMFHVPIPEYGVIMFFLHSGQSKFVYLYRHAEPSAVENKRLAKNTNGPTIQVSPNPARQITQIRFQNTPGLSQVEIFGPSGQRVKTLEKSLTTQALSWNTANFVPGVYIIKAKTGRKTLSKKVSVLR